MTVCTVCLLKVAEWGEMKTRMQQLLEEIENVKKYLKNLNEEALKR